MTQRLQTDARTALRQILERRHRDFVVTVVEQFDLDSPKSRIGSNPIRLEFRRDQPLGTVPDSADSAIPKSLAPQHTPDEAVARGRS